MKGPKEKILGHKETLIVTKEYFEKQNNLLEKLSKFVLLEVKAKSGRLYEIYPLMLSTFTAGQSILLLLEQNLSLEVFVMFRAFIERSINLCYLLLCDDSELKNFIDYGLQKGYRATHSKDESGKHIGVEWNLPKPTKKLLNKIDKFTSPKGREITRWTKLSFEDRLYFVKDKTGDLLSPFLVALFKNIYEDGSESSHGTFYGSLLHIGFVNGITCPAQGQRNTLLYISQALFNFGILIENTFNIISSQTNTEVNNFIKQAADNKDGVNSYFEKFK